MHARNELPRRKQRDIKALRGKPREIKPGGTIQQKTVASQRFKHIWTVLVNLIPLVGVLVFDWRIAMIMALFWAENVLNGIFQAVKMLLVPGDNNVQFSKLYVVPFFCAHYGIFCLVHGTFVFALFGVGAKNPHLFEGSVKSPYLPDALDAALMGSGGHLALLSLIITYSLQFIFHDLPTLRNTAPSLQTLMNEPYSRIIVLHIVLIAGGQLVQMTGSPMPALVLLIALKTIMELTPKRFAKLMAKSGASFRGNTE